MPSHRSPSTDSPSTDSRCYLVTGAAGFIASKVCEFLLAEGHTVVGVDNLNDYYDVRLKDYRLSRLLGTGYQLSGDAKRSVYAAKVEGSESNSGLRSQVPGLSPSQVSSLKDQVTGSDPQVSGFKFQVSLKSDRFKFLHLDIEDMPALDRLFAQSDFSAVFNLAARAGVRYSMENPHVYLSTNTLGTLNILECMRKYGVKKHVLASTSSLYAGCPMPFTEDQPVNTPLSPYAATKKAAEMLSWTWHKIHGIDTTVVRYFTVFGPAGRPDMAPFRFVHWVATGQPIKLFGDGTATRDFTYVDDIARGTILAGKLFGGRMTDDGRQPSEISGLRSQVSLSAIGQATAEGLSAGSPSGFEIINLGGGNRPITIKAMIALIERELNEQSAGSVAGRTVASEQSTGTPVTGHRPPPYKAKIDYLPTNPVDMTDTQADISKAGRLLGWKPEVTPEDGFRQTVDWYLRNREWLCDIKP